MRFHQTPTAKPNPFSDPYPRRTFFTHDEQVMTNISSELSDRTDELSDDAADQAPVDAAPETEATAAADAPIEAEVPAASEPAAGARELSAELLQRIVEGALLAAAKPLAVDDLAALFEDDERPSAQAIRAALAAIAEQSTGRGFELREIASGYRFQVVQEVAPWIARLWEEKPQKYSRALLETLALIAYRQPITRGDIEDIRGVAVATNIIKTLLERDWVRVVGHKDVPGRPAMYATTRRFLDYFNLKNLDELPALADLRDLDALSAQLSIEGADTLLPEQQEGAAGDAPVEAEAVAAVEETDTDIAINAAVTDVEADTDIEDEADTPIQTEAATGTEAAADAEPLEPDTDLNRSED
jgi:segregation and condensation protein B